MVEGIRGGKKKHGNSLWATEAIHGWPWLIRELFWPVFQSAHRLRVFILSVHRPSPTTALDGWELAEKILLRFF